MEPNNVEEKHNIIAVRLENFARQNWLASLQGRLLSRYPGLKSSYLNPSVALLVLNTSTSWKPEDEAFFADLKTQAFFQRWEPLSELPPKPRANKAVYEDIGYRIEEDMPLTRKQQSVLLSQLHDLEQQARSAEDLVKEYNRRTGVLEADIDRLTKRHNHLVGILEALNTMLHITVEGDLEESCDVLDRDTGRVLFRNISFADVYQAVLPLRQMEKQ